MGLILASASPRRAQVLKDEGIAFEAVSTGVDESPQPDESPEMLVRRLAGAKARAAAVLPVRGTSPAYVVGADTAVVLDGPGGRQILGKPVSPDDARGMLLRLSGRTHAVITGLTVIRLPDGAARTEHETTKVTFAALTEQEVEGYIASGEPFGKAGSYAIQGRGGRFITRVEGCYFNVVGLPLALLYRILRELGWSGG